MRPSYDTDRLEREVLGELIEALKMVTLALAGAGGGLLTIGAVRAKMHAEADAAEAQAEFANRQASLIEAQIRQAMTNENRELRDRINGLENAYREQNMELAARDVLIADGKREREAMREEIVELQEARNALKALTDNRTIARDAEMAAIKEELRLCTEDREKRRNGG